MSVDITILILHGVELSDVLNTPLHFLPLTAIDKSWVDVLGRPWLEEIKVIRVTCVIEGNPTLVIQITRETNVSGTIINSNVLLIIEDTGKFNLNTITLILKLEYSGKATWAVTEPAVFVSGRKSLSLMSETEKVVVPFRVALV